MSSAVADGPVSGTVAWPPIELLWEDTPAGDVRGHGMPDELRRLYGGALVVPIPSSRPAVLANFVSTLDGVVALGSGKLSGGALISGHHEPDRFAMGLLRAVADAVVVGAGTLRASKSQRWTPENIHPASARLFAEWRQEMGLSAQPTTVIVTASGDVPTRHTGLSDPTIPVVVATTPAGAERLRAAGLAPHVVVHAASAGDSVTGHDVAVLAQRLGARVVVCEGGPRLIGELVAADVLDELFLTIAPQLVGRGSNRLGLVEGLDLVPPDTRWHDLVAVRRSEHHLFLRYRRRREGRRSEED